MSAVIIPEVPTDHRPTVDLGLSVPVRPGEDETDAVEAALDVIEGALRDAGGEADGLADALFGARPPGDRCLTEAERLRVIAKAIRDCTTPEETGTAAQARFHAREAAGLYERAAEA